MSAQRLLVNVKFIESLEVDGPISDLVMETSYSRRQFRVTLRNRPKKSHAFDFEIEVEGRGATLEVAINRALDSLRSEIEMAEDELRA